MLIITRTPIRTPAFWEILQETLHAVHFLKLLDKMDKYEMYPTRTVGATERTRDVGRTDGRMGWNQYTPPPPPQRNQYTTTTTTSTTTPPLTTTTTPNNNFVVWGYDNRNTRYLHDISTQNRMMFINRRTKQVAHNYWVCRYSVITRIVTQEPVLLKNDFRVPVTNGYILSWHLAGG